MEPKLGELTDKEREALRLLLAGHDAKSSARELDISVHTLNDRLRSARRKLGVTTSKEAARLLAQSEDGTPQSFVHKGLGVEESQQNQDSPAAANEQGEGASSLGLRRKGLLIMSFVVALSLVGIAVVQTNAPASPDTAAMAAPAPASEQPARDWLTLIDDGGFDESYEAAGAPLRDQYAPGLWKFGLTLRMTKGKLESRTLANVAQTGEFEGRKGSEFEILTFNSLFQYNNAQIERVVMERVEGEWKVVSYEITDPEKAAD